MIVTFYTLRNACEGERTFNSKGTVVFKEREGKTATRRSALLGKIVDHVTPLFVMSQTWRVANDASVRMLVMLQ